MQVVDLAHGKEYTHYACYYYNDSTLIEHCEMKGPKFDIDQIVFHPKQGEPWTVSLPKETYSTHRGTALSSGITISEKYKCFFLVSWGVRSLFCLDLYTGEIRWKHRIKNATMFLLEEDYAICFFCYTEIAKIRLSDGEILACYPASSDICRAIPVWRENILVGPLRNRYYLLDHDLREVAVIPGKRIAIPQDCQDKEYLESVVIREAWLLNGTLYLSGFYSAEGIHQLCDSSFPVLPQSFFQAKQNFYQELPLEGLWKSE